MWDLYLASCRVLSGRSAVTEAVTSWVPSRNGWMSGTRVAHTRSLTYLRKKKSSGVISGQCSCQDVGLLCSAQQSVKVFVRVSRTCEVLCVCVCVRVRVRVRVGGGHRVGRRWYAVNSLPGGTRSVPTRQGKRHLLLFLLRRKIAPKTLSFIKSHQTLTSGLSRTACLCMWGFSGFRMRAFCRLTFSSGGT
jgi:hypothetical protein